MDRHHPRVGGQRGAAGQQLRTCQEQHKQGQSPCGEGKFEEVEQSVVGMLGIVDEQHHARTGRQVLEHRDPRREQFLAWVGAGPGKPEQHPGAGVQP